MTAMKSFLQIGFVILAFCGVHSYISKRSDAVARRKEVNLAETELFVGRCVAIAVFAAAFGAAMLLEIMMG